MKRLAHFIVFMYASTTIVLAGESNVLGFGATKCRDISISILTITGRWDQIFAWTSGFLTGVNMQAISDGGTARDLSAVTPAFVIDRVGRYCSQNPNQPMLRAAETILGDLHHSLQR
ncbi:hypothetical protein [Mesorhizobium sp. M0047]|uniref:hypothetical protein n=1 Tax=Mesorhizobium sp. M0047 TaxID=2956859 RepID=UPI0033398798